MFLSSALTVALKCCFFFGQRTCIEFGIPASGIVNMWAALNKPNLNRQTEIPLLCGSKCLLLVFLLVPNVKIK